MSRLPGLMAGALLAPGVFSLDGCTATHRRRLSPHDLRVLHNEAGLDASGFPLHISDGLYFSEVAGDANPQHQEYRDLVRRSLAILADAGRCGPMSLEDLFTCGIKLQRLDAAFADARMDELLDVPHQCVGPDPSHPYAKLTLCRTRLPVRVGEETVAFLFEKFLVIYAYRDDLGALRSTRTPIHSHPANFETVYFRAFGAKSRVIEREFRLVDERGEPLIDKTGALNPRFFTSSKQTWNRICAVEASIHEITPQQNAICLPPFEMEMCLRAAERFVRSVDGLYRPHQVSVYDDIMTQTRYFALDNYFGPLGRVLLYGPSGASLWRHGEWDPMGS